MKTSWSIALVGLLGVTTPSYANEESSVMDAHDAWVARLYAQPKPYKTPPPLPEGQHVSGQDQPSPIMDAHDAWVARLYAQAKEPYRPYALSDNAQHQPAKSMEEASRRGSGNAHAKRTPLSRARVSAAPNSARARR